MATNNQNIKDFIQAVASKLPAELVREKEPLADHTTFKIGGPVDVFVTPRTIEELSFVMQMIDHYQIPLTILGLGSNVLVRDGGIRGAVVSLARMTTVKSCKEGVMTMGSGFLLKEVSEFALANSLTGLEFAVGIPGSLGGAVFMNAGAYISEMSRVVTAVWTVDAKGVCRKYTTGEFDFAYRHSVFQHTGEVIAQVEMTLDAGDAREIQALMEDLTRRRESKQPLEYASAGSTFKRPEGYFAGTLIEETGLKGLSVGDAQVSEKHAGFVINKGHASACDVLTLIGQIQDKVYEAHGVQLEPEVRLLGIDK